FGSGDAIEVNPSDIAGNGLVAGGGCALNVDWSQLPVGCGVWWNGSALEVAHDEIAGRGLVIGNGCAIDLAVGCGLRLGSGDAVE
ncbi:hypothetical protein, partial [Streptococcus pneumoniae]|uniref:hypothetical protein n=1 Tax=Streptococcus pneumoniae TaxID=1313 RepID=UPI0018B08772